MVFLYVYAVAPVVVDIQVEVDGDFQVATNGRFRVNVRDAGNEAVFIIIAEPSVNEVRVFRLNSSGSRSEDIATCGLFYTPNAVRCFLPELIGEYELLEVEAMNAIGSGTGRFERIVQGELNTMGN